MESISYWFMKDVAHVPIVIYINQISNEAVYIYRQCVAIDTTVLNRVCP